MVEAFLRSRDEDSFRSLYRRHAALLYRVSYRLLRGDAAAAEEAVQDVWVRAIGQLPAFRWDSSLGTWLTGIAINRCREMIRTIHSSPRAATAAPSEDPSGGDAGPAQVVDLQRAIADLPDGYREILVLRYLEQLGIGEIAAALDISHTAVTSRHLRALQRLRRMVRDDSGELLP